MAAKYLVRDGGTDVTVEVERDGNGTLRVRREDGDWRTAYLQRVGDSDLYLLLLDHHPIELYLERRRRGAIVTIGRHIYDFQVERWSPSAAGRRRAREGAQGPIRITAPMTGSIVEVRAAPGTPVAAGDVLLVIESMKMNNELRSPADGTVTALPVKAGDRVRHGDLLVEIEATPESDEEA